MENIEINSIIESLAGIFDDQAEGIKKAQSDTARAGSTKSDQDASLLEEFKKYDFDPDGPGEVQNALYMPYDASRADDLADEAKEMTIIVYGYNGHNDAADAFRHAYWSFRMAQKFGAENAKKLGDSHERGNAFRPKFSLDSKSSAPHKKYPGEALMDLKNNQEGRRLFLKHGRGKDLAAEEVADIVRRAAGNGTLRTKPYEIKTVK